MTVRHPQVVARRIYTALAGACLILVVAALGIEAINAAPPCSLCITQRIVYLAAGMAFIMASILYSSPAGRRPLVIVGIAILFVGAFLAFYHLGIQMTWWGSTTCSGTSPGEIAVTDLRAALSSPPPNPCSIIDWTFLGLTLPTWNVGIFAILGAIAIHARKRERISSGKPEA